VESLRIVRAPRQRLAKCQSLVPLAIGRMPGMTGLRPNRAERREPERVTTVACCERTATSRGSSLEAEARDTTSLRRQTLRVNLAPGVDWTSMSATDQRRDVERSPPIVRTEIAQEREGRNDVEPIRGGRGERLAKHTEQDTAHRHDSRCRPGNSCRTSADAAETGRKTM